MSFVAAERADVLDGAALAALPSRPVTTTVVIRAGGTCFCSRWPFS